MSTTVQEIVDTGLASRVAVVATVDGKTQLWGTARNADPERLVRAFPGNFGPHSGNRLRVMSWKDWGRVRVGLPTSSPEEQPPADEAHEHRAAVIAGLRELADFLEDNPETPVDRYALNCVYSSNEKDGDAGAIARVREMAAALGIEVNNTSPGYWRAERRFGGVVYGCSYVARTVMAEHNAAMSYAGAVEPDGGTPGE